MISWTNKGSRTSPAFFFILLLILVLQYGCNSACTEYTDDPCNRYLIEQNLLSVLSGLCQSLMPDWPSTHSGVTATAASISSVTLQKEGFTLHWIFTPIALFHFSSHGMLYCLSIKGICIQRYNFNEQSVIAKIKIFSTMAVAGFSSLQTGVIIKLYCCAMSSDSAVVVKPSMLDSGYLERLWNLFWTQQEN